MPTSDPNNFNASLVTLGMAFLFSLFGTLMRFSQRPASLAEVARNMLAVGAMSGISAGLADWWSLALLPTCGLSAALGYIGPIAVDWAWGRYRSKLDQAL